MGPQKRVTSADKRQYDSGDAHFAKVTLNDDERIQFRAWYDRTIDDLEVLLDTACEEGYRVSVKADIVNRCMSAALTQQLASHHNAELIVMGRSHSALEAIMLTLYKVYELYPGVRLPEQPAALLWG